MACRKSLPAKVGSFAQQGPVGFYLPISHIVSLKVIKFAKAFLNRSAPLVSGIDSARIPAILDERLEEWWRLGTASSRGPGPLGRGDKLASEKDATKKQ